MSKYAALAMLILVIVFAQCRKKSPRTFDEHNLPSQFFDVPVNKDTVITTSKGGIIRIPEGAFSGGAGTHVRLEIKEAYTIADMILGGLTTKAGKELLSSGGMIYINPADNNNVTIKKAISVSIPTDYQRDGMQLFKGEKKPDGSIDWIDPQPLPKQELSEHLQKGKELFNANCASCHNTVKEATGPPLAFLDKRRNWEWLEHFVHNSAAMIAAGDQYACCIYAHYNKTAMTPFPALTSDELHAIFDYANYLARDIDPATVPDFKKSVDSCIIYSRFKTELLNKRDSLVKDNGKFAEVKNVTDPAVSINFSGPGLGGNAPVIPENLVAPTEKSAIYYQVSITTFGWYNIDILMKGLPGFEDSELMVRLTGEYKEEINMFLVIPSEKILVEGGLLKDKDDVYGFYTDDGRIPLPQNVKAYILAMGEQNGQLYFGKTDFATGRKQAPEIKVYVTTKEQMNIEVRKLDIPDFKFAATDSKNADSVRIIDVRLSEIEKMRPKECDCRCGMTDADTASTDEWRGNRGQ